jgi:hypothetical protein
MAVRITDAPAIIDLQIAALAPTQFLKCLQECSSANLCFGIVFGQVHKHADAPHTLRLLRTRRDRPYHRTAEKRDELASLHVSSGEDHGKT